MKRIEVRVREKNTTSMESHTMTGTTSGTTKIQLKRLHELAYDTYLYIINQFIPHCHSK